MINDLKKGKDCIGQYVYDCNGEKGIITNMYTINGHVCVVDIEYSDGTLQTREKFCVRRGSFKKPYNFSLEKDLNNGFKPIYQWEKFYIINKEGVIKSIYGREKGKIKSHSNRYKYSSYKQDSVYVNPYKSVSLYKSGRSSRKLILVHKLVVETFIRPLQEGEEINHINGISSDNRLINLEIVSKKENNKKYFSYDFLNKDQKLKLYKYCNINNYNLKQAIEQIIKEFLSN